jgi:hypothetical protein
MAAVEAEVAAAVKAIKAEAGAVVVARRCTTMVVAAERCVTMKRGECTTITITDIGAAVFGYTTLTTTAPIAGGATVIGIAVITRA